MNSQAPGVSDSAAGYAHLVKFVAFPLAFWGLGALSWYYAVASAPAAQLKSVLLFIALVFAFFWVGVSAQRKGAWSRLYLGIVFGVPVIASGIASVTLLI